MRAERPNPESVRPGLPGALGTVGSSSTRPRFKFETLPAVTEAGVDTWRLLFHTSRDWLTDARMFDVGPYKAQWFPDLGALALEGHPSGIKGDLAAPSTLDDAYGRALDELADRLGHVPTAFKGLSRLDSTVTMSFGDAHEGVAVIAGVGAFDWPGCEVVARSAGHHPPHSVQIVHAKGRAPLGRCYDKGYESGAAARGMLVRFEDQARFPSGRRPGRADFEPGYCRQRFTKRFGPMARAAKGVKVAGIPVLARTMAERVIEGQMTAKEMQVLGGFMLCELSGVRVGSKVTRWRRRRELQEHGLVIADHLAPSVDVDLGAVFERAIDEAVWS